MSLLNQTKRVDIQNDDGSKDWIDVRSLSIGGLREMRREAAKVQAGEGEDADEVQGFELSRLALESCIVGWSDEAPVTPENIDKLPYQVMFEITAAIGLGEVPVPLENGPSSTAT